jgi:hypothetical protein
MDLNIGTADVVNKVLWEEYDADRAAGGFTLADVLPDSATYVLKGAPLTVNYTTRVAVLVKTALVVAGSTTTVTRVEKNHLFKVGDVIADAVSGNGVAITAISYANAAYDTLTHLTNGGAYSAADVLFQAAAVGTGDAAYLYTANALLSDNSKNVGSVTMTAIIGALEIREANLPYSLDTAIKTALGARFQFV